MYLLAIKPELMQIIEHVRAYVNIVAMDEREIHFVTYGFRVNEAQDGVLNTISSNCDILFCLYNNLYNTH